MAFTATRSGYLAIRRPCAVLHLRCRFIWQYDGSAALVFCTAGFHTVALTPTARASQLLIVRVAAASRTRGIGVIGIVTSVTIVTTSISAWIIRRPGW
eukprot:7757332-Pyramimonas_sp.AAC.1